MHVVVRWRHRHILQSQNAGSTLALMSESRRYVYFLKA